MKLIKLTDYLNYVDKTCFIPMNTPITIDGETYTLVKYQNVPKYVIINHSEIIKGFIHYGLIEYQDLYQVLGKSINNKTLSVGDILYDDVMERYYIISRVSFSKICSISLYSGNNYTDAIDVKNVCKITHDEVCRLICSHNIKDFHYVGNAKDVLMVKTC